MTTCVNVKVKYIKPEYHTLYDWMKNPEHEYIGRADIVFVEIDGKKERYPKTSSKWANPFKVKKEGRDKCLKLYENWIREKIEKEGTEELKKLKNKVLGCWCKPEKCHGDILIKILNEYELN